MVRAADLQLTIGAIRDIRQLCPWICCNCELLRLERLCLRQNMALMVYDNAATPMLENLSPLSLSTV